MIPPGSSMQAPPAQQDAAVAVAAVAASRARLLTIALELGLGQPLEARVLGPTFGGMSRLALAGRTLAVLLPEPLPPGTLLQAELRPDPASGQLQLQLRHPPALSPVPPMRVPSPAPVVVTDAVTGPPVPPTPGSAILPAPGTGRTPSPSPLPPVGIVGPAPATPTPAPPPANVPPAAPVADPAAARPGARVLPPIPVVSPPGGPPAPLQAAVPPPVANTTALSPTPAVPTPAPTMAVLPSPAPRAAVAAPVPLVVVEPATARVRAATAAPAPVSGVSASSPAPAFPSRALPAPPAAPSSPPTAGSAVGIALGQATQAAAQQDSVAPLLQNLGALQHRLVQFPRPVAEAALRLLAGRLVLGPAAPDAEQLRQAILRAGVLPPGPVPPGAPAPDFSSGLLQLRSALLGFLGAEIAPIAPVARRPPPPTRDGPLRGLRADPPSLPGSAAPQEAGHTLLQQTDAALSRLRLLQFASQPHETTRAGAPPASADWTLEVPMLLGSELAIAQLRIAGEGGGGGRRRPRSWRLQFAVNFSILGEVGAQIGFSERRTSIALWAAEPATAAALESMLPELEAALAARGLQVGGLRVGRHAPPGGRQRAGQLLDGVR